MISEQKETKQKTYVARYKGKNLIMRSGKSSWRKINHAKAAVLNHFHHLEHLYEYHPHGERDENGRKTPYVFEGWREREKEFRKRLFELIEIVELTE